MAASATGLGGLPAGDAAGHQVEDHDEGDQDQGCRPGAVVGRGLADLVLLVDVEGQRGLGAFEGVRVDQLAAEDQQDDRCRLSRDAGDGEHDAGGDAADRGGQDHLQDGAPLGDAEGEGGLAELVRYELEHLLGGADHDGDHQDGQGQRAHQAGGLDAADQHDRQDEETGHDGRDARHDVDEEGDGLGERALAVLDQVDGGQQSQRCRDDGRDPDLFQGADQGVVDTAAGLGAEDPGHRVAEEVSVEALGAAADRGPEQRGERDDGDEEAHPDYAGGEAVLGLALVLDHGRGDVRDGQEQQGGDQAPLHAAVPAGRQGDPHTEGDSQGGEAEGGPAGEAAAAEAVLAGFRRGLRTLVLDVGGGGVAHALAPEYSLRRAMMSRAAPLTSRVRTKRTRPEAIRASRPNWSASSNFAAMFWANVPPPGLSTCSEMRKLGDRTVATAIVSPSARPRPSIEAEITPERPKGSTERRMTSQRVAPRARAASSFIFGTWRKTSRLTLVTIGRIMIASRMPTVKSERATPTSVFSKMYVQPKNWSSQRFRPSRYGTRTRAPQMPYTMLGTAASR